MTLSFLNPLYLWFIPLASIPVIIHFLSRTRPRVFPFSTLMFLKTASTRSLRRHRLREILLLVLRTLAIAFIVLAFARPVMRLMPPRAGKHALSVVLVVDNSYSTRAVVEGRTVMDRIIESAQRLIEMCPDESELGLVTGGGTSEVILALGSPREKLNQRLDELQATYFSGDIKDGLALAYQMLQEKSEADRVILVVSDGCRHNWDGFTKEDIPYYTQDVRVVVIQPCGELENLAMRDVVLSPGGSVRTVKLTACVSNTGLRVRGERQLTLRAANSIIARGFAGGNDEIIQKDFFIQKPQSSYQMLEVSLERDALPVDDVFWVQVPPQRTIKVLAVDGQPGLSQYQSELYFFSLALSPERGISNVEVHPVSVDQLKPSALEQNEILVLANVKELPEGAVEAIRKFMEQGGGVLVSAGSQLAGSASWLAKIWGSPPGTVTEFPAEGVVGELAHPSLLHPILSGWTDDDIKGLQAASVTRVLRTDIDETDRIILKCGSVPLLVERPVPVVGAGRLLFFATTLDREWTSLPAYPVYVPLMHQIIGYLAPGRGDQQVYCLRVGDEFSQQFPPDSMPVTLNVTRPDAKRMTMLEEITQGFSGFKFIVDEPGIWKIDWSRKSGESSKAVVANMNTLSKESDLAMVETRQLKHIFGSTPLAYVKYGTDMESRLKALLRGRDVTGTFVWLVLALLGLEMWLRRSWRTHTAVILLLLFFLPSVAFAQAGNQFVFTQLKYDGNWDPYPASWEEIIYFLDATTSINPLKKRQVISLKEDELFQSPCFWITGDVKFPQLSDDEIKSLRKYVESGGTIIIDCASGSARSGFGRDVKYQMQRVLEDSKWEKIPETHALLRSFYLMPEVVGRVATQRWLESLNYHGRAAVILSPNDVLGVWLRDTLGNWVYECTPGGETQRLEAMKLTANIVLYALTGTYKQDMVHQPYIKQKLHGR